MFTAPLFEATLRSPVSAEDDTVFALVIVALPVPFTVVAPLTVAALRLPPLSVASSAPSVPVAVTSACASPKVAVPDTSPMFTAPLLEATLRSPVSAVEDTVFALAIVALPVPFTVVAPLTVAALRLPPLSVASSAPSVPVAVTSACASPKVAVPDTSPIFTAPLLEATLRSPVSAEDDTVFALVIVALPVRLSRLRLPDISSAVKLPVVFDTLTSPTVFFVEILPVEFVMAMLPVMSSDLNANADELESPVVAFALSTVMFPLRFPISTAIAVPDADSAEIFFALKSAAAVPAFTPVAFPAVDTTFMLPSFSRTSTPTTPTTPPAPLSTLSAAPESTVSLFVEPSKTTPWAVSFISAVP